MKLRVFSIALAVIVLGGLGWMLFGRAPSPSPIEDDEAEGSTIDRDAILDAKRRAHTATEVDRSPANAQGRVTDAATGAGVVGAVVLLTPRGLDGFAQAISSAQGADGLRAVTDDDGQWHIEEVPAGRYALSATVRGYLPATRPSVTLAPGQDNAGLHLAMQAGGHEVRGSVFDIGGGPVDDVLIRVTRIDGSPFNFSRPGFGAVSDDEGRFAITLADGLYQVRSYHPDYVDATSTLHVDGGPRSLDLRITPASTIEGRVIVRETGEALADARVMRHGDQAAGFVLAGADESAAVTSDAEGRFLLRGLSSGVVRLSATARGYASRQPVEVVVGVAEHVGEVEIIVDQALLISGFVVARGDEERGLPGVLVGAFSVEPPRLFAATAPSAPDGYFEIFGVLPGMYTVAAIGEEALPNFLGASAEVIDEDVTDVLVIMDSGVHVRGRVSPPSAARVSVQVDAGAVSVGTMMQTMSNSLVTGRSSADGTFELHPVADGTLTIVAEADDGSRGEVEIDVAGADVDGLTIDLQPRASVRGRVVGADGAPGRGLDVTLSSVQTAADSGVAFSFGGVVGNHVATTDEGGNFVMRGLDAGDYNVAVSAGRGQILEWAQPADPASPKAPQRLSLGQGEQRDGVALWVEARNGLITGVVVGADGQPVADVWVTALRQDVVQDLQALAKVHQRQQGLDIDIDDGGQGTAPVLDAWARAGLGESPVLTDETGHFEVRDLRAGLYRLRAEAHKDGARGFAADVPAGSDVRIDLRALAGLEGVVRFGGEPVPEYSVLVSGPARRQQQVYATDGRFAVRRLDAGDYEVFVQCSHGTATLDVSIAEGQMTATTIDIGGWGSLRGVVVDAGTGDPIEGLAITVMGAGGPDTRAIMGVFAGDGPTTAPDGSFVVDEVPPGEGTIMFVDRNAATAGGVVGQKSYVIEAEEDHDLGTISGVAPSHVEPSDRGTVGVSVRVATYGRRPRAPLSTDDPERAAFDKTQRLWVTRVTPQGPAAMEGLVPGDEVLAVDGTSVRTMGATNAATLLSPRYLKIGERLSLEIEHGGDRRTIALTVAPRG